MKKFMIILVTLFVAACGSKTTFYNKKYGRVDTDHRYFQADYSRCTKQIGTSYRDRNDWIDKMAKCLQKRGWRA